MRLDRDDSKTIGVDKFMIETRTLGIILSEKDIAILLTLYEDRDRFDKSKKIPSINYEQALKSIIPIITKNSDKISFDKPSELKEKYFFKIGWTVS